MADPLSITLGVLGLAGLFTTVTDIWSFVDAGRGFSEDFSYLRTRLDNQREIFVQWGRRMEFGSAAGYDERLDEPRMRGRIEATLHHIKLIFSNTDDLVKTYGIRIEEKGESGMVGASRSIVAWKPSYERFRATIRRNQKKASSIIVTKWSVKDGAKFRSMVDRISELVNDLDEMTKDFATESCQEEVAFDETSKIANTSDPEDFQRAIPQESAFVDTVVSAGAAGSWPTVKGGYAETIVSSASGSRDIRFDVASDLAATIDTTFYTGKSCQTRPTIAGTITGDRFLLDIDEIPDQDRVLRECVACMEDFLVKSGQPDRSITSICKHDRAICLGCIARSIRIDLQSRGCYGICCPECREKLSEEDVRFFADSDTIIEYQKKKQRHALEINIEEPQVPSQRISEWINRNVKPCPGCGVLIEECIGCDHMICTMCRYEFCWSCGVNYLYIRKKGNHRHKESCRFYFSRGYQHSLD